MNNLKIYFKDEDKLTDHFCQDIAHCSGEQPTESDPSGCCGCDSMDEYVAKNYNLIVSESDYDEFISVEELNKLIDSELEYEKTQSKDSFGKGYFHALRKLKSKIEVKNDV